MPKDRQADYIGPIMGNEVPESINISSKKADQIRTMTVPVGNTSSSMIKPR